MAEGGVGHEENDFSPEFREYMEREHYDASRVTEQLYWEDPVSGWVFWDRRDAYPDPTLDHSLHLNPNLRPSLRVRLKIRGALSKLVLDERFMVGLIQFWAPIKTLEGRTYLTVQNQPFAFCLFDCGPSAFRDRLCQYMYRTGICNLLFDVNAESAEEQLGLPARVFLHKLPEFAPYLSYNTLDLASSCEIKASWAVPVFEKDSPTCAGVLEIASFRPMHLSWYYGDFLDWKGDIFQEFGLSCLDEHNHRTMQCEDKNEAHIAAFKELEGACKSVYENHNVCVASAWVSSRSCSDSLRFLFRLPAVHDNSIMKSIGMFHVRKVHIIGSEVPISSLLCCWDTRECNIYHSMWGFVAGTGCFTMCLRSSNTTELYVVQIFFSMPFGMHNNRLSKLRLIMDTMKGYFGTFRLAYGQEWGEELPLVVIDSLKDQKNHHIEKIPATRYTPDGPVTLQLLSLLNQASVTLQLGYQPSVDSITNGSEAQNSNSPRLASLPNGIEVMRVDSSDQKSHSIVNIPATGYIPSQRRPPSVDSVNNGMYACTEALNSYTLSFTLSDPSRDSLPNGVEMMQVDSSDQKSLSIDTISAIGCIPSRWRLPSVGSVNNGMYACTEALNSYTLSDPSRDSLPDGVEVMQVYSSDQASVDPSNSFEDREQSMELNSDDCVSAVGAFRNHGIQDTNTVTVKAKIENYYTIKFSLSLTPRLIELQQEVAKRNIDPGAYDIIYTDEGEKPIGCDYDLQQWIDKSTLLGNTSIAVTLRPKQPTQT